MFLTKLKNIDDFRGSNLFAYCSLFSSGIALVEARCCFEAFSLHQQRWLHRRRGQNVVRIPRRPDLVSPRCNDYSINYSPASAFHMRPPSFRLVTTKLETKDSRNVENCDIHFSEIVLLFGKIVSYIIDLSKCIIYSSSRDESWVHDE